MGLTIPRKSLQWLQINRLSAHLLPIPRQPRVRPFGMEARGSSIQVWMNGGALNTRGLRCGIKRQKGPQQEVSQQQLRRATGDFESNSTEKNQLEHHSLRGPRRQARRASGRCAPGARAPGSGPRGLSRTCHLLIPGEAQQAESGSPLSPVRVGFSCLSFARGR